MINTSFYTDRIQQFKQKTDALRHQLNYLSFTRLLSFLAAIITFYLLISVSILTGTISAIALTGIFIWSIIKYNRIQQERNFHNRLVEINQNELDAFKGNLENFENGHEFSDTQHPFSHDMDVFGDGSLFQFMNRTRTHEGKSMLAGFLSDNNINRETILNKQQFVHELAGKIDFRHRFHASFTKSDLYTPDQKNDLVEWLYHSGSFFKSKILPILSYILPAVFISMILLSIFKIMPADFLLYPFLLNLLIIGSRLKDINRIHAILSTHGTKLKEYSSILSLIENESFTSEIPKKLKTDLHYKNETSSEILHKLGRQVDLFDNRLNLLVNILLNGSILWDFHCIRNLENWKETHKNSISHWFSTIAAFDAYISLANFAFNYPENVYPEVTNDKPFLLIKEGGHPLINPEDLIRNDFSMDENNFIIVTGANMAGKSTFLRTVGINLILAMAGTVVCAKQFTFKPVKLFTSMRTSDSLQKNESYFYAELKRLKELLQMFHQEHQVMIILDEILKGTNSDDKQKGSKMFLTRLVRKQATGIIATHDISLAALENSHKDRIKNYCFEIDIDGENIQFDYKLKPGITKKMNASLLMEQMGLLDSIDN